MIEPLDYILIPNDDNLVMLRKSMDKLNEVIAEINRQEKRWEKLDESMEKDQPFEHKWVSDGLLIRCSYCGLPAMDAKTCEHEWENTHGAVNVCTKCNLVVLTKRAPEDYKITQDTQFIDTLTEGRIRAYKAQLREKIVAMKPGIYANEDLNTVFQETLDDCLKLLEEA